PHAGCDLLAAPQGAPRRALTRTRGPCYAEVACLLSWRTLDHADRLPKERRARGIRPPPRWLRREGDRLECARELPASRAELKGRRQGEARVRLPGRRDGQVGVRRPQRRRAL